MARWALVLGIFLVSATVLLWLVEPAQKWVLTVVGLRASGETSLDTTCDDYTFGSGSLPVTSILADAERVEVGQSLQEALDQVGANGTVVLASGVHTGQSTRPMGGQTIVGEPGAILRGDGARFAFMSSESSVRIEGLVIEGYEPDDRAGVIHGEEGARGWTISGNEIHNNGQVGIVAKSEWIISENRVHHNGRYGIVGSGTQLLIEDNEIACNANELGATGDSSGTKFVHTTNLVLRGNYAHHNFGNGLWVDINNVDSRIEGNRADDNSLSGIFVEISCGGVVSDNDVAGNGFGTRRPAGMENAGIFVANSPGVEVTTNRVTDNAKGIGALHWAHGNRDAVDECDPELRDLRVYANEISQQTGLVAGIEATIDLREVWTNWGNMFFDNTYVIGPEARFRWTDSTVQFADWLGFGQG